MNMPIGVISNGLAIMLGGIIGTIVGKKMSLELKINLTYIFGLCSMGMGINSIVSMKNMPAVIFAIIMGTGIGLALKLSKGIHYSAVLMQKGISKLIKTNHNQLSENVFFTELVTIIVLFCSSGTGIYGSMLEGFSGDSTILISKCILDFFTAVIFACNLGYIVSLIAIPQLVIGISLFFSAHIILPSTTSDMIADFTACGGFLMLATGFRITKIKDFPIADMIPAIILIMPLSRLWTNYIIPLL